VIDGVMKCMGLIVDGGVRITKSLTTDQRQEGLITDEEFESKKKELLGRL
jgi:hypothetical protein